MKEKMLIYSFDVFDTVVTRTVAEPRDVFLLMGEALESLCPGLPPGLYADFRAARIKAESDARRSAEREDIKIADIYREMASQWGLDDNQRDKLIEVEIDKEIMVSSPVRGTINEIDRLRKKGCRIIFITDMYLPETVIKDILAEAGAFRNGDGLYVSGEIGTMKRSGALFRYVLEKEGCEAAQLCHYGDNLKGDMRVPAQMGIRIHNIVPSAEAGVWAHRACHISYIRPNVYEKTMVNAAAENRKLGLLTAGVSRAVRLSRAHSSAHLQCIWDTASNVAGPQFFFFVWWVLEEAKKRGIERLYFVSRDGQVLLKIAEVIKKEWGYSTDCKYLYGSRQSWFLPAVTSIGEYELDWMADSNVIKTCHNVGLRPEDIKAQLRDYGFTPEMWETRLSGRKKKRLKKCLSQSDVSDKIFRQAALAFTNLSGYLRQMGVPGNGRYAIVDLGWEGKMHHALSEVIRRAGDDPDAGLTGFYLTIYKKPDVHGSDRLISFDLFLGRKYRKLAMNILNEVFAAADHGPVSGFAEEGGRFAPVMEYPVNTEGIKWGVNAQQQAITEFAERFTDLYGGEFPDPDVMRAITKPGFARFLLNPSLMEADTYGSYPMSVSMVERELPEVAPVYGRGDILIWALHLKTLESFWPEGFLTRGGHKVLKMLYSIYSKFSPKKWK